MFLFKRWTHFFVLVLIAAAISMACGPGESANPELDSYFRELNQIESQLSASFEEVKETDKAASDAATTPLEVHELDQKFYANMAALASEATARIANLEVPAGVESEHARYLHSAERFAAILSDASDTVDSLPPSLALVSELNESFAALASVFLDMAAACEDLNRVAKNEGLESRVDCPGTDDLA